MKKRFENILILSDIDGTFLGKGGRIVERNLEAIERFKSDGGLFTFNTGRTHSNIYAAVRDAGDIANAPAALSNGACLYDTKGHKTIENYFMSEIACREFTLYIKENFKDVGMRASTADYFLASPDDEIAKNNIIRMKTDEYAFLPIEEWRFDNWYKMVVLGDGDRLEEIKPLFNSHFEGRFAEGGGFVCERSARTMLEIHRADRSKADVIATYRNFYSDRDLTVYAVGDYENDRDVLSSADVAVCPANALDSIKEICHMTLCDHDEGVIADLIERLYKEF